MTLRFSSPLPSSKSEKTHHDQETVTLHSTAQVCDPLLNMPKISLYGHLLPCKGNMLALAMKKTPVLFPVVEGGLQSAISSKLCVLPDNKSTGEFNPTCAGTGKALWIGEMTYGMYMVLSVFMLLPPRRCCSFLKGHRSETKSMN